MKTSRVISVFAALVFISLMILVDRDPTSSTIHLAGDSTMAAQLATKRPLTGWGEPFATMRCDNVRVLNHAENGSSTKRFLADGHWQNLLRQLRAGDIVLIQFGHNDQKAGRADVYSSAWREYRDNLQHFVESARAGGAEPVLLTPIVRRAFDALGALQQTHGDYPSVAQAVAADMDVHLIDLHAKTYDLVATLGPVESKALYLHLAAGAHKNYVSGEQDDTHLSRLGALRVATIVASDLREMYPGLLCPD